MCLGECCVVTSNKNVPLTSLIVGVFVGMDGRVVDESGVVGEDGVETVVVGCLRVVSFSFSLSFGEDVTLFNNYISIKVQFLKV